MNRRRFLKLSLFGGFAALVSYPVFIERNIVLVNRYRIPVAGLPPSFYGFTIAHLTDLHLGFLVSDEFIRGLVQRTNDLKTDIIVCTGDYVHERNSTRQIDTVWPILSNLQAKEGVYSVLGNHDHWADTDRSHYWLKRSGQDLHHRSVVLTRGGQRLVLGGAGDLWLDRLNIDAAFADVDENDCKILLAHNPDSADTKFNSKVSLVLSGHTHGGQVVLPFIGAPVLPVKNKKYASGLVDTEMKNTRMFISRGIGWAIYPVRLNCFPEIAVLELVGLHAG